MRNGNAIQYVSVGASGMESEILANVGAWALEPSSCEPNGSAVLSTQTGSILVREIGGSSDDKLQWNRYLDQNHESNFYQRYEWKAINEQEFGHRTYFLAAENATGIVGVFPVVFIQSQLFGRLLCSMPFVNFGGPVVDNVAAEDALIDRAVQIAELVRADYLEIRSPRPRSRQMPTDVRKVSMSLDLDPDPDVLWNTFKSKHRTSTRRAYKENFHVVSGTTDLLDTFYTVMVQSWRALGTPFYRKRYFQNILDTFGDDIRIFVAYRNGEPVATALNGHFKQTVEGMWAGGVPTSRSLQANYVLYWEMIKDACERGFCTYNLGRSTAGSGAEAFKKKWNARPQQLFWQYHLNRADSVPQLNTDNAKYSLPIAVWKRLPLPVVRLLGPVLSKSIP